MVKERSQQLLSATDLFERVHNLVGEGLHVVRKVVGQIGVLDMRPDRLHGVADTLATRYGDERTARLFRTLAAELDEAVHETEDELLTLQQAADLSGYTADHLRHLVADGSIPNDGERGQPRIRRRDLPTKPGTSVDAGEDEATRAARSILKAVGA